MRAYEVGVQVLAQLGLTPGGFRRQHRALMAL